MAEVVEDKDSESMWEGPKERLQLFHNFVWCTMRILKKHFTINKSPDGQSWKNLSTMVNNRALDYNTK